MALRLRRFRKLPADIQGALITRHGNGVVNIDGQFDISVDSEEAAQIAASMNNGYAPLEDEGQCLILADC